MTVGELKREVRAVQKVMDNGTDHALFEILRALYLRGVSDGMKQQIEKNAGDANAISTQ